MLENSALASRVSTAVYEILVDVMTEQGLDATDINDDAKLVDGLGLKSMDIAQVVVTLEEDLEVDPFQDLPITSIQTVGDLIKAYVGYVDPSQAEVELKEKESEQQTASAPRRSNRRR